MHRLVISKQDVERAAWDVERKPESMSADDFANFGRLPSNLRKTEEKGETPTRRSDFRQEEPRQNPYVAITVSGR